MKLSDLPFGKKFTIPDSSDPNRVYTKVNKVNAGCCTPEHNVTYEFPNKQQGYKLLEPNTEVEVYRHLDIQDELLEQILPDATPVPATSPQVIDNDEDIFDDLEPVDELLEPIPPPIRMRLGRVPRDVTFIYNNAKYILSDTGRSGGGRIAVLNLDTLEETTLPAIEWCDIIEEIS